MTNRLTRWPTDWLNDCPLNQRMTNDRPIDSLTEWLDDLPTGSMTYGQTRWPDLLTDWPAQPLTRWLADWLNDGPNDSLNNLLSQWLTDCLDDWLTDSMTDWMTRKLTDQLWQLTDWLDEWLDDWPTDTITDWLTDWLAEWLDVWPTDTMTDWLIQWLTDWPTLITYWLTRWVARCLTDWHNHWLIQYCNPLLFRCRFNFGTNIFTKIKSLPIFSLRVDGFWTPLALPKFSSYRNGEFSLYRKLYATEIKVDYTSWLTDQLW